MASQGINKTWAKNNPSPYQLHDITHRPYWETLVICDAYFNNLASGFMIISCIAWLCGPLMYLVTLPVVLTLALCILFLDLGLLIADLGDSWRFFHSLRVMRFTSPLSVGVWGLSCFAIFLSLAVLFMWISYCMGSMGGVGGLFVYALARLFTIMALLASVVVICYKGVVFSCSSQPGVKDARWLTPFMVSDSLLMGLSLYVIVMLAIDPKFALPLILPMVVLLFARSITFGLLWQDVKIRARKVYHRENEFLGWTVIGVCGILSVFLVFMGVFGLALAALLNLVCGYVERHWMIGLTKHI